jgi:hypothetical protein
MGATIPVANNVSLGNQIQITYNAVLLSAIAALAPVQLTPAALRAQLSAIALVNPSQVDLTALLTQLYDNTLEVSL